MLHRWGLGRGSHRRTCLPASHAGWQASKRCSPVLAAWAAADVYPDAPLAFRALHSAGLRLAVLTNGSGAAGVRDLLQTRRMRCHSRRLPASPPRPRSGRDCAAGAAKGRVEGLFSPFWMWA